MNRHLCFLAVLVALLAPGTVSAQVFVSGNASDMGAQINAAQASLPSSGGKIIIKNLASGQCYSYGVPIVITTPTILEGQGPSTCLSFTGTGTAISFIGNGVTIIPSTTYADGFGLRDLTLVGAGPGAGQTGMAIGGPNGSVGFYAMGVTISNFGLGLRFNRGVWNFKFEHSLFWDNGQSVLWPSDLAFGGENLEFDSVTFAGATFLNSLHFNADIGGGFSNMNNLTFVSCNFDNAQLVIDNGSGSVRLYSPHFENAGGLSGDQPFLRILASTIATDVVVDGADFYNDQSNPYPPSFIEIDGGPAVVITQMRSVNLDGTNNVPTNLIINGNSQVTLIGDAPLRAAKQQYIVVSGSPEISVVGGGDSSNSITSQSPMTISQSYESDDSTAPVIQIGGSGYQPTIGFNLWTGVGSSFYGMQIRETGPNELDFCTNGAGALGANSYICNAGVVNGVFKSTVPDGTAPFMVASHTPPGNLNAWPATFSPSGAQIQNPHITTGKVTLPVSGQAIVLFQNGSQFSETPACTLSYQAPLVVTHVAESNRPEEVVRHTSKAPTSRGRASNQTSRTQLILPGDPVINAFRQLTGNPSPTGLSITGQQNFGVYFICIGN